MRVHAHPHPLYHLLSSLHINSTESLSFHCLTVFPFFVVVPSFCVRFLPPSFLFHLGLGPSTMKIRLFRREQKTEECRRVPVGGFSGEAQKQYPNNYITTSKYTFYSFIFKNLFEQFRRVANLYFLVISFFQVCPSPPSFPPSHFCPCGTNHHRHPHIVLGTLHTAHSRSLAHRSLHNPSPTVYRHLRDCHQRTHRRHCLQFLAQAHHELPLFAHDCAVTVDRNGTKRTAKSTRARPSCGTVCKGVSVSAHGRASAWVRS